MEEPCAEERESEREVRSRIRKSEEFEKHNPFLLNPAIMSSTSPPHCTVSGGLVLTQVARKRINELPIRAPTWIEDEGVNPREVVVYPREEEKYEMETESLETEAIDVEEHPKKEILVQRARLLTQFFHLAKLPLPITLTIKKRFKKTIIVGLEGTLICTPRGMEGGNSNSMHSPNSPPPIPYSKTPRGSEILLRDYSHDFLGFGSELFELILYTSLSAEYVAEIVELIDPKKEFFDHILTRENCAKGGGMYLKTLDVIQNRRPEDIMILDESIAGWIHDLDNLVPVSSFYGQHDDVLLNISLYICKLHEATDVRTVNKRQFGLYKLLQLEQ